MQRQAHDQANEALSLAKNLRVETRDGRAIQVAALAECGVKPLRREFFGAAGDRVFHAVRRASSNASCCTACRCSRSLDIAERLELPLLFGCNSGRDLRRLEPHAFAQMLGQPSRVRILLNQGVKRVARVGWRR